MVHSSKCRYSTKNVSSSVRHSKSLKMSKSSSHSLQQKGSQKPPPPNLNVKVGICQVHNWILRQVILFLSDQSSSFMHLGEENITGFSRDDMWSSISFIICPPKSWKTQVRKESNSPHMQLQRVKVIGPSLWTRFENNDLESAVLRSKKNWGPRAMPPCPWNVTTFRCIQSSSSSSSWASCAQQWHWWYPQKLDGETRRCTSS